MSTVKQFVIPIRQGHSFCDESVIMSLCCWSGRGALFSLSVTVGGTCMNPKVAARQARLLQMLESKEEIRIGREQDCPLPLPQLVRLTEDHPDVVKVYGHGLTAEVFHLKVEGTTGA